MHTNTQWFAFLLIMLLIAGCSSSGGGGGGGTTDPVPAFTTEAYISAESATIKTDGYYTEGSFQSGNNCEGTGQIVRISSITSRKGSYALEFIADEGAGITRIKDRTELYLIRDIPLGAEKCSAFSFKLAGDFPPIDNWFLLHQWHQSSPESPPIAVEIKPGTDSVLRVVIRYGANVNSLTKLNFDHPIVKGEWIDIVTQWKVDLSNGIMKLWLNGELKVNYAGPIGYSNVSDNLINEKFGVYRYTQYFRHQIFYDEIRIGNRVN
jgi:hypothetical protein